ncbi:MAG: retention module-containing protein, partial [Methylophilus sp.]
MAVIGKIVALTGKAFLVQADGSKRELQLGESIQEGQTIVTADGGQLQLQMDSGRMIDIPGGQTVAMTEDLHTFFADTSWGDQAIDMATIQTVLQALESGESIDQVVEAAAAGQLGLGGDGSHGIVQLSRIVFDIDRGAGVNASAATSNVDIDAQRVGDPNNFALATPTAQLDPNSDSGTKGDNTTNDNTPTIIGTGTPGNTIEIIGVGTAVVGGGGTWSITPTTPLADGPHDLVAVERNPAGQVSPPATVSVTIDTTAPTPTATLDPASDTGVVGDNITSDNTPTIVGTGEPGNTITLLDPNGTPLGTAVVDGGGKWSITPTTPLPEGPNALTVTEEDPAGNVSAPVPMPVTIDTTAPTPTATLDPASDTG